MDRVISNQQMCTLLSDKNKFKKLSEDPTKLSKGQLQQYLREFKKKQFLDDATYERIYPSGSQPSGLYGRLRFIKLHLILKFLHLDQIFQKRFVAQKTNDLNISWSSNFFRKYFMAPPINFSFLFKAYL